ncbi:hypothetical protein ACFWTE_00070 [Nocardiopsis sp. NPDC058631]|uniref:hypothetical protein n=1 Tax=Nocardiopsis sp. NPDC058631 TaxID=3346566 RepID=UPI003661C209
MPPTTDRVDVPAAHTLLGEVAAAMTGLPPSAPADLDGARSRHTELVVGDAAPAGTRRDDYYVQVSRYDRGDYVLPHRDSLRQGLYMLTTSDRDGLNAQHDEATVVFVPDRAGTRVEHDPRAWHWVAPVAAEERFTLVTIPPLPPRADAARREAG